MSHGRLRTFRHSRLTAILTAIGLTITSGGLAIAIAANNDKVGTDTIGTGERPVFVPITPCRVMDTRPAPNTVGPRNTPIGASATYSPVVLGANGNCVIPGDALGLGMNVTIVSPTAASFLTVFPTGAPKPVTSNLNWTSGHAPIANAVTVRIGTAGKISFFNNKGKVHVVADIVGYYVDHEHDDITGAMIVDGSLNGDAEIADNTITTFDIATDAIDSDEVLDFGLSNQDVGVLFAQVEADATIDNSSGGVTGSRLGTGTYEIDFGRDISSCAFTATQGEAGIGGAAGAIMGVTDRAGNSEAVFVTARTDANVLADRAFQLIVVC
jgi:hypothetical protein